MTNTFQINLYNDLMNLVESSEAFYYKDFKFGSSIYRIFNYRLASYTDFLAPNALECRGTMFEVSDETSNAEMIRLAVLPMEKFFNLNENPFTMNLDLSTVDLIESKADGSLISTFYHDSHNSHLFWLKTRGSLFSEQCNDSMKFLNETENIEFLKKLRTLTLADYTVNMEWCAPTNRVVIGYEKPQLRILNIRNLVNGKYIERDNPLVSHNIQLQRNWIEFFVVENPKEFIENIPNQVGIEGYVFRLSSGQRVKRKTDWYLALHHTKDSINSPRRLFEAVLEETTDDMRSMFYDDSVAIKMIEEMELKVDHLYNHHVDQVERFYEKNKHLGRKDYAILGQKELPRLIFPLVMSKYIGREIDYKAWMKKHWKDFGIKDDTAETTPVCNKMRLNKLKNE